MPFLEAPLAQDPLHGKNAEGVEETHNLGRRTRAIPATPLLPLETKDGCFVLTAVLL